MRMLRLGALREPEAVSAETTWFWMDSAFAGLVLLFVVLALRYQLYLLNYMEWGDEAETVVTAKMIVAGQTLYSQIFNHHGPLTFLTGIIVEKFGGHSIAAHRLPIAALQISALLAICFSPIAPHRLAGMFYAVIIATLVLLAFPSIFGHTYIYQVLCGLFLVIILAQYTMPAIAMPEALGPVRVFVGNFLLAAIPFLAINYAVVAGAFSRVAQNGACKVGDPRGLSRRGPQPTAPIGDRLHRRLPRISRLPKFADPTALHRPNFPGTAAHGAHRGGAGAHVLAGLGGIGCRGCNPSDLCKRDPWRALLLGMGVLSLLMRGENFHALPYFYSLTALGTLLLPWNIPE